MQAQSITFALEDRSDGFEVSPERVKLGDLVRFADDVQTFLRGETREVDTQELDVAIRKGSLAISTEPIAAATGLFSDLRAMLAAELLEGVDAKRREVVERWQKAARQSREVAYRIAAPFLDRELVISSATDFHADDADQWVEVERYIRGEIQDLGGITKANAHVRLPDGSTLKVTTDKAMLRDDQVNRLYKSAMLRIKARYNVVTRELRDARLVEFVEYATQVREDDLARLFRRGAVAWGDVPDASAWVEDLRGGRH